MAAPRRKVREFKRKIPSRPLRSRRVPPPPSSARKPPLRRAERAAPSLRALPAGGALARSGVVNPAVAYLASLAEGSRRAQAGALAIVARILSPRGPRPDPLGYPWHTLRFQHTQAVRARLAEDFAPATANRILCALRRVLEFARKLGLMTPEEESAAGDLASVRGRREPRGRMLDAAELRALFDGCAADPTFRGRRNAALLGLLYGAGLRRAEAVGLLLADYLPAQAEIRVRGKGGKERTVSVPPGARSLLDEYLALRGAAPGALLCTQGALDDAGPGPGESVRPMTDQAVYVLLRRLGDAHGVDRCSPHDLRRTFASALLDRGADIAVVQRMMGHASVATTARYDRRGRAAETRASHLLEVPPAEEDRGVSRGRGDSAANPSAAS